MFGPSPGDTFSVRSVGSVPRRAPSARRSRAA